MKALAISLAAATFAAFVGDAHAQAFDPAAGQVTVAGALISAGFEDGKVPVATPIAAFDRSGLMINAGDLRGAIAHAPGEAIEGDRVLMISGGLAFARIDLRALNERLIGRRVEVRLWQRPLGTRVSAAVAWYAGPVASLFRSPDSDGPHLLAYLPFQPTGNATDDGWLELTSGPVDFALGGTIGASMIQIAEERGWEPRGAIDDDPRAWIDALSIVDLGPAEVPARACRLLDEIATCGAGGACLYGRCVDAKAAIGPMLEDPELRAEYLARRSFELRTFEGGRAPKAVAGRMRGFMERLAEEKSPARYWTGVFRAFREIGDGHASAPEPGGRRQIGSGVCLHLGEADLLPQPARLPMVFAKAPTRLTGRHPIAVQLEPGDVLVSIDGAPVSAFARAASRYLSYAGDPAGREFTTTPELMDAAITSGARVRFARCRAFGASSAGAVRACLRDEVQTIDIDLSALLEGLWRGEVPTWRDEILSCDYRFRRSVEAAGADSSLFVGVVDRGDVRHLLINGVPGYRSWNDGIDRAFSGLGSKLLLDERLGMGGTIDGVERIAGYLLASEDLYGMDLMPPLDQSLTATLSEGFRRCARASGGGSGGPMDLCGGYLEWRVGEGHPVGPNAQHVKLAIATGYDISGNDFLTRMLAYRRRGRTRIFGPAPTAGAFGVIWGLPGFGPEIRGGSIQVQDTIFRATDSDPSTEFSTGTGVEPHVVVLQKQSDVLRGVDTVIEAASAWLRSEEE